MTEHIKFSGRILFLTEDTALIRQQLEARDEAATTLETELAGRLLGGALPLMSNISTDEITPGWVCFYYDETLGQYVYVGMREGAVKKDEVKNGGFAVVVVEVSSRERDEDVFETGVPGGKPGQFPSGLTEILEERGQGEMRLADRQAVIFAFATDGPNSGDLPEFPVGIDDRRAAGDAKADDVFAAETSNQFVRRPEGDDLAMIDDRHAVAEPLRFLHEVSR